MSSEQIDELCTDWLEGNCATGIAVQYKNHSLVIPIWNSPELNNCLETLRQALSIAFNPDKSLGSIEHSEARRKLGLPMNRLAIPEIFIKAFSGDYK